MITDCEIFFVKRTPQEKQTEGVSGVVDVDFLILVFIISYRSMQIVPQIHSLFIFLRIPN